MGLSRLENFLKDTRGTILHVNPNSLDATDSIENTGTSAVRPFISLQRCIAEASRYSYQRGLNNDRFNKTTILLYPGDHLVDNRPGYIATGPGTYAARSGETNLTDLTQWDLDTQFDLTNPDNALYKLNSIFGGIIIPRGTSLIAYDLRKTRIRPTYVPNPENDAIERSAIFRVTGGCYFWQFTILDADPNGTCYKDYTKNVFVPNFSHHKLTGFEYADGVNPININDSFLTYSDSTRTDLDNYYDKIAAVYGAASGREIQPDYGNGTIDIQPVIDEYRIVGSTGASVGITSIRAGDGTLSGATNTITVDLVNTIEGLSVDSPIQIQGVNSPGYDGQYVISSVPSSTKITYQVQNVPTNPLPGITGSTLSLSVDTVTSASPYIFNISLRSVYGMCGLLADGNKATGFKSMVVAQYTGIGLQKDENAFVKYDSLAGQYKDSTALTNLHTDSKSKFKPSYENFHIKATNDAFLQLVSVFAIGYAEHFVTENGGDIALNNSNSNFGAKSLVSSGFKRTAFPQDDYGYITHIIPPKEIESSESTVEFASLDVGLTNSVGNSSRLYLYGQNNLNTPPNVIINGYHIGAKQNELLNVQIYQNNIATSYSSRVVMPYGPYNSTESSSEKIFTVGRSSVGINSISSVDYTFTLTQSHSLLVGESIRVIADNGYLPDGLESNQVYYAITKESVPSLGTDQIRIAKTFNDAINGNAIQLNEKGGTLSIVSRVSDKNAGEKGHPIQWDGSNWYITVSTTNNQIYSAINSLGIPVIGNATNRTYITRKTDNRNLIDTLYRVRYVLPKDSPVTARPPIDGFILQDSNNIIGGGTAEISQLYTGSISNSTALRNPRFIADASWSSGTVTITTELRHNLKVGDQIEVVNISPSGYNGTYTIVSTPTAKRFTYALTSNPGTFANSTTVRDSNLPYFRRKKYNKTYQVYRTQEIQPYVANVQDGIYYLTLINHSNYPKVAPFSSQSFAQPVENLYPQTNLDNPKSDPDAASSFAVSDIVGKVVVNDLQNSITKETLQSFIGFGITDIRSSSDTAHTIYTTVDHTFSGITSVSIVSGGSNYGSGASGELYNARLVGFAGSTTGSHATAKITINGSGTITGVKIIDGGSAYGIGNTLRVVGVATTSGFVEGVVKVQTISNNIGDIIKISGITSASYSGYNTLYQITGVTTSRQINVSSSETITGYSTSGIGSIVTSNASYLPTGKVVSISSLTYDSISGIATVTSGNSHGFKVDNKVKITGANETAFNGDFIVKNIVGINTFIVNIGAASTTSTSATGSLSAYRPTLTSYGGELIQDTEKTSGRLIYEYAGITTTLGADYLISYSDQTNNLNIPNAVSLGFNLGDYLLIDNEIFRIRNAVTSDAVSVLRAVLGSPRETHITGSVITRIAVRPVELRRNSIIRASGHTFEYLGFGPGNYSTSLPQKQNRVLSSTEKFLAQSTKTDGGIVVYTGMDSEGSFYAGNKKINSATGKEESFDAPLPSITGEKKENNLVNVTETQKLFVTSSVKVNGGVDKNSTSEFDGPVIFNNKVTANSDIEANAVLIQGQEKISRRFSISNTQPSYSSNFGDVIFNSEPSKYDYIGWTYGTENTWLPFGFIGEQGVGISSNSSYVGFSTLLNIVATGITFTAVRDNSTGISTLRFDADPRIGIYTGVNASNFLGNVKSLNFVGSAISITGSTNAGIATIYISNVTGTGGTSPGLPLNSFQWNNNDKLAGQSIAYYDSNLQQIRLGNSPGSSIDNAVFFNSSGSVGLGSTQASAKLDIITQNTNAVNIRTFGTNDVIRITDTLNNRTSFVLDGNGRVGINTNTPLTNSILDVNGSVSIAGTVRLYNSNRSNFVGFSVGTLTSNLTFTLPTSYGSNNQVLFTNGSGVLSWKQVSNQEVVAGTGITVSYATVGSGITVATISNTGITSVTAGAGITVSYSSGTATIGLSTSISQGLKLPFITSGFSFIV